MTLTLLVLALVAAANPFRGLAARPIDADRSVVGVALAATLAFAAASALLSGSLLDLVDVSGPSARIAGGVALLVVALKDVFTSPPGPEPALPGWKAGVVPLAFPVLFSPAVALLAVAGASERGVGLALVAVAVALVPSAVLLEFAPARRLRPFVSAVGVAGVGIAALVVLDGVYAI